MFAIRPIHMLFTVKVVVSALVNTERQFVYPADAHHACRIVLVIAGVFAVRLFVPLKYIVLL